MDQKQILNIPHRSLVYLSAGVTVILLVLFLGVLPYHRALHRMDIKLAELRLQIEEQKALAPVYGALQKKTYRKETPLLPLPPRTALPREQIEKISSSLRALGSSHKMEVLSVSPDLNFLAGDTKFLQVNTTARGDFFNFRQFLTGMGGLPYLEHIEEIDIHPTTDGMEFTLKLWLAVS